MDSARLSRLLAPLIPLLLLGAVGVAVAIAALGADRVVGWVGYTVGGLVLLWVLAASFWPASADRKCPACGEERLERLDPETTMGVRCTACGHVDETKTGWFLAEEEGPLEELVLRQRELKRAARQRRRAPGKQPPLPPQA